MYNSSPTPLKAAKQAMVLHTFGVQVLGPRVCKLYGSGSEFWVQGGWVIELFPPGALTFLLLHETGLTPSRTPSNCNPQTATQPNELVCWPYEVLNL